MTRDDKKEMVLKLIRMNHADGLTEAEVCDHFENSEIGRGSIREFLKEMTDKDGLLRLVSHGRIKVYKEITK